MPDTSICVRSAAFVIQRSGIISTTDDLDSLGRLGPGGKLALIAQLLGCRPEALMDGGELTGQVGEAAHLLKLFLDIKDPESRRALMDLASKLAAT